MDSSFNLDTRIHTYAALSLVISQVRLRRRDGRHLWLQQTEALMLGRVLPLRHPGEAVKRGGHDACRLLVLSACAGLSLCYSGDFSVLRYLS